MGTRACLYKPILSLFKITIDMDEKILPAVLLPNMVGVVTEFNASNLEEAVLQRADLELLLHKFIMLLHDATFLRGYGRELVWSVHNMCREHPTFSLLD